MRTTTRLWLTTGSVVLTAALLSACGGADPVTPPPPVTTAPATTTSAAPATTAPATSEPAEADDREPVDCGPIDAPNGPVGLIAVATEAGTVGCTEAINVISEYLERAPTESEGTAHALTVAGWSCLADTGAQGSGTIGCDKDGLAFHTVPAGA